jgi:hypothetical protein
MEGYGPMVDISTISEKIKIKPAAALFWALPAESADWWILHLDRSGQLDVSQSVS